MAVPRTKTELLDAIETSFAKLIVELETFPPERVLEGSFEGHVAGTAMSLHNLVAYLVGWNELVLKWHRRLAEGLETDFPETGYRWNELGALAQKFYADYADLPYPDLVERLRVAKSNLVALIESRSDAELYGAPWYGKWTMGRMIQFNSSSPYANARGRIRKWKKAATAA